MTPAPDPGQPGCQPPSHPVFNLSMLYQVGQEVVLMSLPGRFRIIDVDGEIITIENATGVRKRVLEQAVRPVPAQP